MNKIAKKIKNKIITSHEPSEGNDFGLVQNILQVGCSTVQGHLFDGLGCLSGVLYGGNKY